MTKKNGNKVKIFRIIFQSLFFVFFFCLLFRTGNSNLEIAGISNFFFFTDPLILLTHFLATGKVLGVLLFSLIPIFFTFIFGRFFCGWVCPFGALNHFFSWIFLKKKKAPPPKKKLLKLKYLILIVVLFSALMNTHLVGWLDPFSLFTRTSATVIEPALNYSVEHLLKTGTKDKGVFPFLLKAPYKLAKTRVLKKESRHSSQAVFLGLIFFTIIFLNLYAHRFFCNYLCPLGALYGFLSKFSFLNLKPNQACTKCKWCSKNCTYYGSPYEYYQKSECMVCFNCIKDCPVDSIEVSFALPKSKNRTSLDLSRREFTGSLTAGLFLGTLGRLSVFDKHKVHPFMRPPGSVSEKEFLKKCIRCGACIQACPTNFIQPALFQTGIDGLWTPVLSAKMGYCDYECKKCLEICSTNAIEDLSLEEKKELKIGTAVIDKNRCYTYADGYNCAVCEEHCPLPDKAIKYRKVKVWNFEGNLVEVDQIYVNSELCIGCGICENVCPRSDAPGIFITAEEEDREFGY